MSSPFEDLRRYVIHLEARISHLEEKLSENENIEKLPPPRGINEEVRYKSVNPPPYKPRERIIQPEPTGFKLPDDWEKQLGQKWVPRIFMVLLILGVLWGFKAAVDRHVLSDGAKVGLGFLATGILFVFGHFQMKAKHASLGHVLLGGAVAVGMLSTFALTNLYHFVSAPVGFGLDVVIALIGLVLAYIYRSEVLSIFSTIGLFVTPFLVQSNEPNLQFVLGYTLLVYLLVLALAIRRQHWISLSVQFFLFQGAFLIYAFVTHPSPSALLMFIMAISIQHFVAFFALLLVQYKPSLLESKSVDASFLSGVQVYYYENFVASMMWIFTTGIKFNYWFFFGYALIYLILGIYAKRTTKHAWLNSIFDIWLSFGAFAFAFFILSSDWNLFHTKLSFYLVEGLLALYIAFRYDRIKLYVTGGFIYSFALLLSMMQGVDQWFNGRSINHIIAIVTLLLLAWIIAKSPLKKDSVKQVFMVLIQFLILFCLIPYFRLILEDYSLRIQFYSYIGILYGYFVLTMNTRRLKYFEYVGYASEGMIYLSLMAVTLLPMISKSDTYFMLYLMTQLVYLAIIYVTATRTKFPLKKNQDFKDFKLPVIQLILFFFVNKFLLIGFEQFNVWSDSRYVIHSIICFVFALVSIYLGRQKKERSVAIIGWVILAITLAKLIFIDLNQTALWIRAILFITIGLIGLIYSRTFFEKGEHTSMFPFKKKQ